MHEREQDAAKSADNQSEKESLQGMGPMVFGKDELNVIKRAQGEKAERDEKPYLPKHIRTRLEALDREMAEEKAGRNSDSASSGTEEETGARFYDAARPWVEKARAGAQRSYTKFRANLRIFLIICIAFAGYYLYAEYVREPELESLEDLKAALPVYVDDVTRLTAIEDGEQHFVMHFVKDASVYEGISVAEREASLDRIEKNAQRLCNNPLLGSIVRQGRSLTVILSAEDHSYERRIVIDSCPLAEGTP